MLADIVGTANMSTGASTLTLHSHDESYHRGAGVESFRFFGALVSECYLTFQTNSKKMIRTVFRARHQKRTL